MAKSYASQKEMVTEIMWAIADAVPGADIGVSSKSISHYVEVNVEVGDEIETRRVRISDHDAVASCGGNIVHEIDLRELVIEEVYDDCNEFDGIVVANDYLIAEMIEGATKALHA